MEYKIIQNKVSVTICILRENHTLLMEINHKLRYVTAKLKFLWGVTRHYIWRHRNSTATKHISLNHPIRNTHTSGSIIKKIIVYLLSIFQSLSYFLLFFFIFISFYACFFITVLLFIHSYFVFCLIFLSSFLVHNIQLFRSC
jgi:hypothetical protein